MRGTLIYDNSRSSCYLFVFHVLQPLLITLIQQNLCCVSKSTTTYQQKMDSKLDYPNLVLIIGNVCMLVPITEYIGPPKFVHN